jgi:hypothetical protein
MTQYRIVITGMTQYCIVINKEQLLQYDTESTHSYYNTILSHFTVITIRSFITPQFLQFYTESFHSYYNTMLNNWNDSVLYCNK